ncbi:MAG: response regulator [Anaerolineales bacterium]
MARILVVEDDAIMRPTLRDLLQLEGHTVLTATDGLEALAILGDTQIDLVITDFAMPQLDGLGLVSALRADPRLSSLPVIMFTASGTPGVCDAAFEAGANEFLLRPITPQHLFTSVQRLLPLPAEEET